MSLLGATSWFRLHSSLFDFERWWAGRDNAALPEPASSHANCPKNAQSSSRPVHYPGVLPGRVVSLRPLFTVQYAHFELYTQRR